MIFSVNHATHNYFVYNTIIISYNVKKCNTNFYNCEVNEIYALYLAINKKNNDKTDKLLYNKDNIYKGGMKNEMF